MIKNYQNAAKMLYEITYVDLMTCCEEIGYIEAATEAEAMHNWHEQNEGKPAHHIKALHTV